MSKIRVEQKLRLMRGVDLDIDLCMYVYSFGI